MIKISFVSALIVLFKFFIKMLVKEVKFMLFDRFDRSNQRLKNDGQIDFRFE